MICIPNLGAGFKGCFHQAPAFDIQLKEHTAVRPDLQGLEITKGELKHLSGVSIDAVVRPPTPRKFLEEVFNTLLLIGLIFVSNFLLILAFPDHRLALIAAHAVVAAILIIQDAIKIFFSLNHRHFINLIDDVHRFNITIKGIDINDQIEAAGNPRVGLKDRDRVIKALKLTREDIIRALKTEKVLRENERFIKVNPDLFANNLTALAALQVNEQASEYGRILNEAFQIGLSIQDEMKQLKTRHLNE
ncbi:hypothetical protein [Argonema galeatum]|uniref:hypothetical protein n=1 Tax=Argonema galeatum TaxID=2942762 RepID=UPI0030842819